MLPAPGTNIHKTISNVWNKRLVACFGLILMAMAHRIKVSPVISFGNFVKRRNVTWDYWYLLTWMRIICIYPPTKDAPSVIQKIALIVRYALWMAILVSNVLQQILLYKFDYSESSGTEYWNTVIDYWNWTIHNVCILSWIVFIGLRKNKWTQLMESLINNDYRIQPHQSIPFSKLRKLNIIGMFYIFVAVRRKM